MEGYLKEKAEKRNGDEAAGELPDEAEKALSDIEKVSEKVKSWTLEDFEINAHCIYEEELCISADGYISYAYSYGDGGGSEATVLVDMLFEEKAPGLSECVSVFGDDPVHFETFELLENGNIKLRIYEYDMR